MKMRTGTSSLVLPACVLALLASLTLPAAGLAHPGAPPATRQEQQRSYFASAEELDSLELQARQLDEIIAEVVRSGEPVSDEVGEEQMSIFAELARLQEIQQRRANIGGAGTGVERSLTEVLGDRIAALRVALRPPEIALAGEASVIRGAERGGTADEPPTGLPTPVSIPNGTRVLIKLKGWLNSKDAQEGDRFEATAIEAVKVDGRVVVPEGALFQGYVAEVEKGRRPSRGGKLKLIIDRVQGLDGQITAVNATVVGAAYGEELEGDGVDGSGALKRGIVGAILGGLFGGGKGALAGIAIGSGSTVFAGKGEDVDLPPGTQLRVRFDTSVSVTWGPVLR